MEQSICILSEPSTLSKHALDSPLALVLLLPAIRITPRVAEKRAEFFIYLFIFHKQTFPFRTDLDPYWVG